MGDLADLCGSSILEPKMSVYRDNKSGNLIECSISSDKSCYRAEESQVASDLSAKDRLDSGLMMYGYVLFLQMTFAFWKCFKFQQFHSCFNIADHLCILLPFESFADAHIIDEDVVFVHHAVIRFLIVDIATMKQWSVFTFTFNFKHLFI